MAAKKNIKKIMEEKRKDLIAATWPELAPGTTWDRLSKNTFGFTTIPRCMPYFMDIMDHLSSGSPLSSVYFTLWCYASDEGLVQIKNEQVMAFEAGLKGQRSISVWKAKMKRLKDLGFILAEGGVSGDFSYVLIKNPYHVVKDLIQGPESNEGLKKTYRALVERANEVGAKDLKE